MLPWFGLLKPWRGFRLTAVTVPWSFMPTARSVIMSFWDCIY